MKIEILFNLLKNQDLGAVRFTSIFLLKGLSLSTEAVIRSISPLRTKTIEIGINPAAAPPAIGPAIPPS
ncbi:hypothetical protein D3C85_1384060 [compost metagenome]